MKRFFLSILLILTISIIPVFATSNSAVLTGGVIFVPENFFGMWRVVSSLEDTDSPVTFKQKSLDLWNISQESNVIKLSNPFSGAVAELEVKDATVNRVEFIKNSKYGSKILTDMVVITINEDTFVGENRLRLDTLSESGKVIKSETAKYSLKGERLSGQNVLGY